ncbi:MAG: hypothetical protein QM617_06380 [Comamonas sp.]
MALPWMTALKLIPWTDVIAATPQVLKGAQKLYDSVRNRPKAPETPVSAAEIEQLAHDPQAIASRVQALHARLGRLEQQQRDTAELLRALAEQNERLVAAVDGLRGRARTLQRLGYGLAAVVGVLLVLVWRSA